MMNAIGSSTVSSKSLTPKQALIRISTGHFFVDLCQGVLPLTLPFLLDKLTLNYGQAALIITVAYLTSSIAQPLFSFNRRPLLRRMAFLLGVPVACLGLFAATRVTTYRALLIAVIVSSFGTAMYHPEATAQAHSASDTGQAGKGMALYVLSGSVGFTSGAMFFGPLLAIFKLPIVALLLLPAVLIPPLLFPIFLQKHPNIGSASPSVTPKQEKSVALAMTFTVIVIALRQWALAGLVTLLPLYFNSYLHKPAIIGGFMMFALQFGGDVGTFTCGRLVGKLGYRRTILGGLLLSVPALLAFPHTYGIWTVLLLFLGGGFLAIPVLGTTLIGQELLSGNRALAAALTLGVGMGLGGIGSGYFGHLADLRGMPFALTCVGLVPLLAAVMSLTLPHSRQQPR